MLAPGDRVGPYTALFQLGKGGMGEVWAAARQQTDVGFTKLFALKVVAKDEVGENDSLMFFDEAKAASALQHPAIVPTFELGQDGRVLYIAMDLVRGPSLTALLQRLVIHETRLTPAMVAHVGVRIGSALEYAYARAHLDGQRLRLIHRDVSPHNVLIDLDGSVRLTDFGVARTAVQDHRSRVGTIRGKPSYMAPEQVAGGAIDARTDVFALGIVLYECACLRRLFGRREPMKSMDAVVRHQPKPLSDLVSGFPAALARVIDRALQKAPEARYASAGAFVEALEAVARDLPGWGRADRDLISLVESLFEPGAFDVDARAKEGLELAERREARAGLLAKVSSSELEPPDAGRTTVWPQAPAPDPLAPEAIEELRTQLRPVAASPAPMAAATSYASYPSLGSAPSLPPRPRRLTVAAGGVAGVLGLVALGFVLGRSTQTTPSAPSALSAPPSTPPPAPPERADPVVEVRPAAAPPVQAAPAEREAGAPAVDAAPPEAPAAPAPRPARVARAARGDAPRSPEAAPARSKPRASDPPTRDATFAEVRDLIREVREVDPERGDAMLPTLLEAGPANVATLNRLRTEARALLEAARGE